MVDVHIQEQKVEDHHPEFVGVSVITTSGAYPKKGQKEVKITDLVAKFLSEAQKELHLTDTTGWIVSAEGKDINPDKTFAQNGLQDKVILQWHAPHGGGG